MSTPPKMTGRIKHEDLIVVHGSPFQQLTIITRIGWTTSVPPGVSGSFDVSPETLTFRLIWHCARL